MTLIVVSHDLSFVHAKVRNVLCVSDEVHLHQTHDLTDELADSLYRRNVKIVGHHHHQHDHDIKKK